MKKSCGAIRENGQERRGGYSAPNRFAYNKLSAAIVGLAFASFVVPVCAQNVTPPAPENSELSYVQWVKNKAYDTAVQGLDNLAYYTGPVIHPVINAGSVVIEGGAHLVKEGIKTHVQKVGNVATRIQEGAREAERLLEESASSFLTGAGFAVTGVLIHGAVNTALITTATAKAAAAAGQYPVRAAAAAIAAGAAYVGARQFETVETVTDEFEQTLLFTGIPPSLTNYVETKVPNPEAFRTGHNQASTVAHTSLVLYETTKLAINTKKAYDADREKKKAIAKINAPRVVPEDMIAQRDQAANVRNDAYQEWEELHGRADILEQGAEHGRAVARARAAIAVSLNTDDKRGAWIDHLNRNYPGNPIIEELVADRAAMIRADRINEFFEVTNRFLENNPAPNAIGDQPDVLFAAVDGAADGVIVPSLEIAGAAQQVRDLAPVEGADPFQNIDLGNIAEAAQTAANEARAAKSAFKEVRDVYRERQALLDATTRNVNAANIARPLAERDLAQAVNAQQAASEVMRASAVKVALNPMVLEAARDEVSTRVVEPLKTEMYTQYSKSKAEDAWTYIKSFVSPAEQPPTTPNLSLAQRISSVVDSVTLQDLTKTVLPSSALDQAKQQKQAEQQKQVERAKNFFQQLEISDETKKKLAEVEQAEKKLAELQLAVITQREPTAQKLAELRQTAQKIAELKQSALDELEPTAQKIAELWQAAQEQVEQELAEQKQAQQKQTEQKLAEQKQEQAEQKLVEQEQAEQEQAEQAEQEQAEQEQAEQELAEQEQAELAALEASNLLVEVNQVALPAEKVAIRPAAGSYNSNAWAANTMFQMSLGDRLSSYQRDETDPQHGSAWIRYSGSRSHLKDSTGEMLTKGDKNAVMMGVDMLKQSNNGRNQVTFGVMGGYGHYSGNTRSDNFNYSNDGKVDGYGVGLYGTVQQNVDTQHGFYADSWVLWNHFDNRVKGGDLPAEKYDAKGMTASLELGYNINLAERNNVKYVLQPRTQAIYQNVRSENFRQADGTRVDFLNSSRVQTVVGMRAAAQISTGLTSVVTPHIEANWLHSTKGYRVRLDDDGSEMNSGRNAGQLKLGVQGDLNRNVSLNLEVFHNQGTDRYHETGGNLTAKYRY